MVDKEYYWSHREECKAYSLKWYHNMSQEHKKRRLAQGKKWGRLHRLTTSDGVTHSGLSKRPRPDDICELCGKKTEKLAYHHWDDTNLSKGIWVCFLCHMLCENVDNGGKKLIEVYELKKTLLDLTLKEEDNADGD